MIAILKKNVFLNLYMTMIMIAVLTKKLLDETNFLGSLIIVLLNASPKPLQQGYKQLKTHSEFDNYCKTNRILGLKIGDRCHE